MGIETVITCDRCRRDISDEDFASLHVDFEIEHNRSNEGDVRKRVSGIYCTECGHSVWERLAADKALAEVRP